MKALARLVASLVIISVAAKAEDQAKLLAKVDSMPVALSHDFEFRKTKLYSLGRRPSAIAASAVSKKFQPTRGDGPHSSVAEASLNFESRYRLFGAVTSLDQRERSGNYFDFFWRAKRKADVTVRLEYRQEQLRSFVQAREIRYSSARGNHKTEFAIVGDDYFDDGPVIAWRCLLIENGQIVAENRSYLWR